MKQIYNYILLTLLVSSFLPSGHCQETWSKLNDFSGGVRAYGVAFAHVNKLYFGQGSSGNVEINDFWEYDISTSVWTNKSPLLGKGRIGSVGFASDKYGFIGLGQTGPTTLVKTFYRYSFDSNTWTRIADFPGVARKFAVCFVIKDKAYVGGGSDGNNSLKDFYCLDLLTMSWITLPTFPGIEISSPYSFSIGDNGYVVCGDNYMSTGGSNYINDVYAFDSKTNIWSAKGKFPGNNRANGASFSINNKGYVVLGNTSTGATTDTWEYIPASDTWNKSTSFPGSVRVQLSSAIFNNHAYIFGGRLGGTSYTAECYSFTDQSSGIYDLNKQNSSINISPNPFLNYLQIDGNIIAPFSASIYDLNGRLIQNENDNFRIELPENIKNGMYILIIKGEGCTKTFRITKN